MEKLSDKILEEALLNNTNPKRFGVIAKELIEEAKELEEAKEQFISVFPQLEFFQENRGYYSSMPFIPQDFDFEHKSVHRKGSPTIDVYHKNGYGVAKMASGKWMFSGLEDKNDPDKPVFEMEFTINNAFEAYIILRAIGISVPVIKTDEEE